ncbi:MAG: hypothetical protein HGA37_09745 [Lentimicrobium sp.]|nr:hypothetical protein [Lentimicrobium sp.]
MQTSLFEEQEENQAKGLKIVVKGQKPLSKNQQTFNKLIKRIETLEHDIESEHEKLIRLLEYYRKEIKPLEVKNADFNIKLAMTLGNATKVIKFTKKQQAHIAEVIVDICDSAFAIKEPTKEQEKFYDQWSEASYQEEKEFQQQEAKEDLADMLNNVYGLDINPDDFEDTPEGFARMQAELKAHIEHTQEMDKEQQKKNKKSPKQQDKAAALKLKELSRIKNFRSIYIALAKVLHPDTEADETLKAEKEEIMKKVISAYEQKDLPALLKLEMAWVHKTAEHLEKLTDEKLKIYISALKEQAADLEEEKLDLYNHPRYHDVFDYAFLPEKEAMKTIMNSRAYFKQIQQDLKTYISVFEQTNSKNQILGFVDGFLEFKDDQDDLEDKVKYYY